MLLYFVLYVCPNWEQITFLQVSLVVYIVDFMSWADVSPDQLHRPIYLCHWLSITYWDAYGATPQAGIFRGFRGACSLLRKSTRAKATAVIWFQFLRLRLQSLHKVNVNTRVGSPHGMGETRLSRRMYNLWPFDDK